MTLFFLLLALMFILWLADQAKPSKG